MGGRGSGAEGSDMRRSIIFVVSPRAGKNKTRTTKQNAPDLTQLDGAEGPIVKDCAMIGSAYNQGWRFSVLARSFSIAR